MNRTGETDLVVFRCKDEIGFLVLNDPPRNTMSSGFFRAFREAVASAEHSAARAIVVYGAGRHFSAGADTQELISFLASEPDPAQEPGRSVEGPMFEQNMQSFGALRDLGRPVVAAVSGVCVGSGFELALWAHTRVCGPRAVMGFPETDFGLMPGCGGTFLLPRLVGRAKALELILSGHRFGAEEAYDLGVVDQIARKNAVLETAIEVARRLSPFPS